MQQGDWLGLGMDFPGKPWGLPTPGSSRPSPLPNPPLSHQHVTPPQTRLCTCRHPEKPAGYFWGLSPALLVLAH